MEWCSLHFDFEPCDLMDSNCSVNSRDFFRYELFGDDDFWLEYKNNLRNRAKQWLSFYYRERDGDKR